MVNFLQLTDLPMPKCTNTRLSKQICLTLTRKVFHVFAGTEMKEILQKAVELARAGYWDAAIDLIESAIAMLETK